MLAALPVAGFTADRRLSPIRSDPFTLGVASGEPSARWCGDLDRLAPNPLADDGFGGMPARRVDVEWEVARDEWFKHIVRRGMATAAPESAHSVHIELHGLRPGADYFYRFRAGGHVSPPAEHAPRPNTDRWRR